MMVCVKVAPGKASVALVVSVRLSPMFWSVNIRSRQNSSPTHISKPVGPVWISVPVRSVMVTGASGILLVHAITVNSTSRFTVPITVPNASYWVTSITAM